tara:strand:- start:1010 stop:3793 length:2784 start_codon:yes stop_codon:yes gene_type:complete
MNIIDRKLMILFITIIVLVTIVSIPSNSKLGEIYFKSYKYELALEYFNKSKALDSDSPKTLRQLKDYFLVQGQVEKALQMQIKICEVLTRSKKDMLELVQLNEWTNKPYEALRAKERYAALLDPEEKTILLHQIGQGYRWLRKYADADRIAESLSYSERIDYLIADLEYYVSSSNFEKVIELTTKLRRLGVRSEKFKLLQAQSYEVQGQLAQAIVAYKKYLSDNPDYHSYSAYKIVPSAAFYAQNLRTYEKIIFLHQKNGDSDILVNLYEEIFNAGTKDYEIALSAIVLRYQSGDLDKMIPLLEKVYESNNFRDLYRSGDIYRLLKDFKSAVKHFEKAHKLAPNNTDVLEALADTYEDLGENRKALHYQYKLLKKLKRKNTQRGSSSYHYMFESELYAQSSGSTGVSGTKSKIRNTQRKILYLLEKIGDKETRHRELLRYVKLYPLDTRIRLELAYSYAARGDDLNAKKTYQQVYEINNQDRDSVFFLADDHFANGEYDDAFSKLSLLPYDKRDYPYLNRYEQSARMIGHDKAEEICQDVLKSKRRPFKQYAFAELLARCYDYQSEPAESARVMAEYLRFEPKNKYARLSIAYYLIKADDIVRATFIANGLDKDFPTDKDIDQLLIYLEELRLKKLRDRAWRFQTYIHVFSDNFNGISFWDNDYKLTKYFYPWSFSASYSLQDPYYNSSLINDLKIHAGYEKPNNYSVELYAGKNLTNNKQSIFGGEFYKEISPRATIISNFNIRKQVFENRDFSDTQVPTVSNYSADLIYKHRPKHTISYGLEYKSYELFDGLEKMDYIEARLTWDYELSPRWFIGPYFFERHSLSSTPFISTILPEFVSTQCFHVKRKHIVRTKEEPLSNETDACVGITRTKLDGVGGYLNLSNTTKLQYKRDHDFELRFELDQPVYKDLNQVFSIYAGYSYWMY